MGAKFCGIDIEDLYGCTIIPTEVYSFSFGHRPNLVRCLCMDIWDAYELEFLERLDF